MILTTFRGKELFTTQYIPGYATTDNGIAVSRWKHGLGGLGEEWHQIGMRPNQEGYYQVTVKMFDGTIINMGIHVLMCWIFHGQKPLPGPKKIRWGALHKDGETENNTPGNLYWGDLDEDNPADRDRHGRTVRGSRVKHLAKLHEREIPGIRTRLAAKESDTRIARDHHVCPNTIRAIRLGHTWKHVP